MTRASDTAKLLGAGATILDGTTISTADNTTQLTLTSTDADASVGPVMTLKRDSSSPADDDAMGFLKFDGENSASEQISYASINARSADVTDGTEDGKLDVYLMQGGTSLNKLSFNTTETVFNEDSGDVDFRVESNGNANMIFVDGGNDAVVVGQSAPDTTLSGGTPAFQVIGSDHSSFASLTRRVASSSGPVLILAKSRNTSVGSHTVVQNGDVTGEIVFIADDGTDFDSRTASIKSEVDAAPGANDTPGRLIFMTTADGANSPTENMRITKDGDVLFQKTTAATSGAGTYFNVPTNVSTMPVYLRFCKTYSGVREGISFAHNDSQVGGITFNDSAASFNTSSDYRLKESVTYDFDATTRLKQLKPARFNFIADADKTVDGFLAHEVSSIVPEAISGTKDELQVWEDGEKLPDGVSVGDNKLDDKDNTIPKYQSIDQSKLVPLLVKTIQELEARITTLENA